MNEVLIVTFDQLTAARDAMSRLRRLADDDAVNVHAAAIVVRDADGRFWIPEDEEHIGFTGTATGGAIGALLGALIGPIGLLFFGATGALVGSLVDAEDANVSEEVLAAVTRQVPPGTTALIADVDESTPGIVDPVMQAAGGRVARRPRAQIEEELASIREAVDAARREAARVLRERRKAAGKESIGDRLSGLVEKISPRR
ncbi:MAG: DUF1269 domain-containing protein [Actinomycetota bacterium]|nr:DUF1269 domain-containing protein [Actinomycetota bacterium]